MNIGRLGVLNRTWRDAGCILAAMLSLFAMSGTQVLAGAESANPARKAGKYVFAHYMVCFCPPDGPGATVADYQREILSAQQHGIDGFALNCGDWNATPSSYYKTRVLAIYEAAQKLGTDFKLFISADYASSLSLEETRDMVETFRNHPNQFRHQGKPVLSTWVGGRKEADFIRKEFQGDRAIVFVPCFLSTGNADSFGLAEVNQLVRDYPGIDGYFYFGASGNTGILVEGTRLHAQRWHESGKLFMASATPYYRGLGMNYRLFERNGFEGMAAQWEVAIKSDADWMEITTWNDLGEASYVGPVGSPAYVKKLAARYGAILSHDGYLDASRYYIDWFKTGTPPAITSDQIFYFYRLHPKNLEGVNKPGYKGTDNPSGWKALQDDVYVTALLKAPAKLTIYSGETSKSFDLPAGLRHVRLPFAPGSQRFILQRDGKTLIDKVGEHEISATDAWGNFNYFSGSAQAGTLPQPL
ncbi:MAG: glycoside hydrolase family 71 protein [Victivallales bacterium]|jgi:hypothetical protein